MIDPLVTTWPAGRVLTRCYDVEFGSRDFYPSSPAKPSRFSPFVPHGAAQPLPVLYAADRREGAVAETVFHDLPMRGPKRVPRSYLRSRQMLDLEPVRDLRLIDLTSNGLRRLQVSREVLIEQGPRVYARTGQWAAALHAWPGRADGLMWVSRQYDTSLAVVLFGDRVAMQDLRRVASTTALPLDFGPGYDLVAQMADEADITIVAAE